MSKYSAKTTSHRQLKVGELIRHKISEELLRGSFFEDLESNLSVTVTEVKMSSNLKTVHVASSIFCLDVYITSAN